MTELQPRQFLRTHYGHAYGNGQKHDSPEESRVSMCRRIHEVLRNPGNQKVLDLGSGPQSFFKQLLAFKNSHVDLSEPAFFSLDQAPIPKSKLLARKYPNVTHVEGDGGSLPFQDEVFDIVTSNHAVDFFEEMAFTEAHRVLRTGGRAIFYFHHPDLLILKDTLSVKETTRIFWEYLSRNQILFETPEEIDATLSPLFRIDDISMASDSKDKWWEVVLSK